MLAAAGQAPHYLGLVEFGRCLLSHPTHTTRHFPQPLLAAAGLAPHYLGPVEFGRCLRAAACDLLRREKLPALLEAADRELWLSWVDALIGEHVRLLHAVC